MIGAPDVLFRAHGIPVPKGSKDLVRVKGRPIMIDSNANELRTWAGAVAEAARLTLPDGWQPLVGPVACSLAFGLPRPATHPVKSRTWPTWRNDVDKLTRAVYDAVTTAGVWRDDGQVVAGYTVKDWWPLIPGLTLPGVAVAVWRIDESEHLRDGALPLPYAIAPLGEATA